MKVTVCFGNVRVVVPCGDGELLVRDLIYNAIVRYKKATGKSSDSWVVVHKLKSFSDGGILDPDDKLNDVADDREQLLAVYEEQGPPTLTVNNGDGASASSVGTDSPDIFQGGDSRRFHNDVEITCDTIPLGIMPLQVRRGSEPALNRLSPVPTITCDPMKRWSAAVFGDEGGSEISTSIRNDELSDEGIEFPPSNDHLQVKDELVPFSRLSRDSGRLSILGNTSETLRWVEAADRQLSKNHEIKHVENGTNYSSDGSSSRTTNAQSPEITVIMKNEGGPLGIHVVPDYNETGQDVGLLVQGIEPGGRIDRDGRLQVHDRIIEINGQSLLNVTFQQAQEIFKEALQTSEIKLRLLKASENVVGLSPGSTSTLPSKKGVISVAARNASAVLVANTRKIGKKIHIQLTKGSEGLGFSITTRDNPAGGNCPIYIKNILPKGAAIQDGRLKPGDRLLEVNAIEMTGKTQTEAVTILRNTPLGGAVSLVVSRQDTESPKLPREMMDSVSNDHSSQTACVHDNVKTEKPSDHVIMPWKHREILTFDIPLNDTGSAGLGVSVKGKTSTNASGTIDLGIFVKSVITGGAASKDGRLQENDQLVNVNGSSLLGKSNTQAMESLRRAIQLEGPNPNAITLAVARRIASPTRDEALGKGNVGSDNYVGYNVPSDSNSDSFDRNTNRSRTSYNNLDIDQNKNYRMPDHKIEDKDLGLDVPIRNPVIDRLTGQQTMMNSMRNESYYCATHHSWNSSPISSNDISLEFPRLHNLGSMTSPTVNLTMDDTIIIEDDDNNLSSNSKFAISSTPDNKKEAPGITENDGNLITQEQKLAFSNMSQMSLDESGKTFLRDGFGRQSMSEKRHAQLDAKNTDTYQRNKKAREDKEKQQDHDPTDSSSGDLSNIPILRANSADSLLSVPRSSQSSADFVGKDAGHGLKTKSNSLESLQTLVAETRDEENLEDKFDRPPIKAVRVRGCNESFRAAVDRSYDVPAGSPTKAMETLDEESESGSSGLGRGNSRQSSLSGEFIPEDFYRYGRKPKKKGLFKGLGSVFKFGKNRKLSTDQLPRLTVQDLERQKLETEKQRARKAAQDEQERIQEQYRKLLHRQMDPQSLRPVAANNNHLSKEEKMEKMSEGCGSNRQDRMNLLRAQHQRKHQQRQGVYPGDAQEDDMKESIYGPADNHNKNRLYKKRDEPEIAHIRSRSYEIHKDGRSKPAIHDSNKYSHYANYEEIQQHLKQQELSKQEERSSSNYYEFESIRAGFNSVSLSDANTNSLPRPALRKRPVQPVSSNPFDSGKSFSSRKDKVKDIVTASRLESSNGKFGNQLQIPYLINSKFDPASHHRHMTNTSSKV